MPTPHISAEKGMIAKDVLMPGDPRRAKFIAENYLEGPQLVNEVRGMLAYTGTYKGKKITVMGSGMGIPSIGIYSYELFHFYDVENIIRVGSAISYSEDIGLLGVVIGDSSVSESNFARVQNGTTDCVLYPSKELFKKLLDSAAKAGKPVHTGRIYSSDVFYGEPETHRVFEGEKKSCVCGEMESFGLYHNANITGKNAATILTISDSAFFSEELSSEQRENGLKDMIEIALNSLVD